jgi:hypothetical protein
VGPLLLREVAVREGGDVAQMGMGVFIGIGFDGPGKRLWVLDEIREPEPDVLEPDRPEPDAPEPEALEDEAEGST